MNNNWGFFAKREDSLLFILHNNILDIQKYSLHLRKYTQAAIYVEWLEIIYLSYPEGQKVFHDCTTFLQLGIWNEDNTWDTQVN